MGAKAFALDQKAMGSDGLSVSQLHQAQVCRQGICAKQKMLGRTGGDAWQLWRSEGKWGAPTCNDRSNLGKDRSWIKG